MEPINDVLVVDLVHTRFAQTMKGYVKEHEKEIRTEAILRLRGQGKTYDQIATEIGCTFDVVYQTVKKYLIETKKREEKK